MSVKVIALIHPFKSERIELDIEPGKTIKQIYHDIAKDTEFPNIRVFVNGELVEDLKFIPKDGDHVTIRAIPQKDVSPGKLIGIVGFTLMLASVLAVPLTGGFSLTAFTIGASMFATGYGIEAGWFVPSLPDISGVGIEKPETAPQIRGSRNRQAQNAPVPVVLGKHYIVPPLGNFPYTTQTSDAQYLNQLFILGYGPLRISDIRFGEQSVFPISGGVTPSAGAPYTATSDTLEECDVEIRYDTAKMGLVPYQVTDDLVNVELKSVDGAITRDTADNTSKITVDLLFPMGLVKFNKEGKKKEYQVRIEAWFKVYGAPDSTYQLFRSKLFTGKSTEAIRSSFSVTPYGVPPNKYTVKVQKVTEDADDTLIYDTVYWTYLKSFEMEDNLSTYARGKVVRLAIQCKATNQLNGVIDQLSCVAESVVPIYSGSGSGATQWNTIAPSSNPAALYLYMLRGAPNSDPVPNSRIDWPALESWYTWCATNNFQCNMVLTKAMPLIDVLRLIASTGRASPTMIDGKYSIVHDIPKSSIIQHFTPRNTANFSGVRAFRDLPHALKCNFVNAEVGWQPDQRIVYDDGYNSANATKFETIDIQGVTNKDQVWKIGRYKIADAKLRPEVFTFETDWENIVCTRGDRVKLSHDVLLIGLAHGRVRSLVLDDDDIIGIIGDEEMPMEAGKTYGIRFRTATGTLLKNVVTNPGYQKMILFDSPAPEGSILEGDLYSFGESGLETIDCLVAAIAPKDEYAAELMLVEYAPGVFTADSGEIPEWQSNVTLPADLPYAPQVPSILSVRSDGTVLLKQPDGSWISRILVTIQPSGGTVKPNQYELNYRLNDTDEEWKVITIPSDQNQFWISPVDELFTYDIRVRAVSDKQVNSAWSAIVEHTVVGKIAPPQDVETVTATVRGVEGIEIKWTQVDDKDLSHYEVRVGANWNDGEEIFSGLASQYLWAVQEAGTYRVMVKAVDTIGNKSLVEAYQEVEIVAPGAVQNLTSQVVENSVLVAWSPPATGSLPIAKYLIYRGDDFEEAEIIGELTGTFFLITEADIDTYNYWIVAVDAAGNVGAESDIEASITTIAVSGTTGNPLTPTIVAFGYIKSIAVYADKQADLAGQYFYHVQVSIDQTNWYQPRLDGVDWKQGAEGGYGTVPSELFYHTNIPYAGTEEAPEGVTLYYRMRRVKQASPLVLSDWSSVVSASTRAVEKEDIGAGSITADKVDVAVLNALIAQVNESLVVSPDYGWLAGNYSSPSEGNYRAYLDEDELKFQIYTSDAWKDKIFIGKNGSEWVGKIATRIEVPVLCATEDEDLQEGFWETVFYEDWSTGYGDRWTNYAGQGETTVENGMLKVGNNSGNDEVWFIANESIVYDSNYIYRIGVGVKRDAGTGRSYAGFAGRNAADDAFINISGQDSYSSQHYFSFSGYDSDSYAYRFGYACGNSGTVTAPKNSELNPGVMYTGVAKIRALVLVNYNGVAGITYISPVVIQRKKKNSTTGYPIKTRTVLNDSELRFEGVNNDGTIRLLNKLYIDDQALSTSGSLFVSKNAGAEEARIEIGLGRTANGLAYIDLIGDTTYTDYGLRIIRDNSGANTNSSIRHRGTGSLILDVQDGGLLTIKTNGSERMLINSSGNVCIGTASDGGYKVNVNGNLGVSGVGYHTKGRKPAVVYSNNGVIYRSTIWSLLSPLVPNTGDKRMISGGGTIAAASASIGGRSLMTFAYIERYSSTEIRIHGVNSTQAQTKQYAIVTNSSTTGFVDSGEGLVFSV